MPELRQPVTIVSDPEWYPDARESTRFGLLVYASPVTHPGGQDTRQPRSGRLYLSVEVKTAGDRDQPYKRFSAEPVWTKPVRTILQPLVCIKHQVPGGVGVIECRIAGSGESSIQVK